MGAFRGNSCEYHLRLWCRLGTGVIVMNYLHRLVAISALPLLAQSAASIPDPAQTTASDSTPVASSVPAAKSEPQPLEYSEIITVEGKTKADLFAAARSWFVDTFRDSKNVIEVNDEGRGELTAKATYEYRAAAFIAQTLTSGWVTYRVSIYVKDGKAKIEVGRFIHEGTDAPLAKAINYGLITDARFPPKLKGMTDGASAKNWALLQSQSKAEADRLIKSATAALRNAKSSAGDNW